MITMSGQRRVLLGIVCCAILTIVLRIFLIGESLYIDVAEEVKSNNSTLIAQQLDGVIDAYFDNNSTTKWYFKPREALMYNYNYRFIEKSGHICRDNEKPFLIILSLTQYDHIASRHAIRSTWGSVAQTKTWPLSNKTYDSVKLLFLSGKKDTTNAPDDIDQQVKHEMETFGDIVLIDFNDNYLNLTIKMIMAFKWIQKFCPDTKYVLKTDEDVFVHVPNIIEHLKSEGNDSRCHVRGYVLTVPVVNRFGKWGVSRDVYPFYRYPLYTSGTSYLISGNIINKLVYAAEHMPFIPNEDAFIAGVLRVAVGAELCHTTGFTFRVEGRPKLCSFHNQLRKVATSTDDALKIDLWRSLHDAEIQDCYQQRTPRIPNHPLEKWLTVRKLR